MRISFRIYGLLVLLFIGSTSLCAQGSDPFGDLNIHLYDGSMTMTVQVQQNGVIVSEGIVAAFIDGELHGKEPIGAGTHPNVAFLTIHGTYLDKYQYLQFKVFTSGRVFTFNPTPAIDFEDYWWKNIGSTSDPFIISIPACLDDRGDNNEMLTAYDGQTIDVVLYDRTLYKDGKWNTLCLPFSVTLSGSPLNGAVARPLTAASISGTTLHLTFGGEVTTLVAGTPYIIKWESGDNIVNPVFNGVTIDATEHNYDNAAEGDARVRFIGTYSSTTFTAADNSILLMGGENKLYYPATGAGIGAQRAYFKIGDGAQLARPLTAFNIDFGEGDNATGIINVSAETRIIADGWYSLDGRKLSGKPSVKGVYVNNGRKVIIK